MPKIVGREAEGRADRKIQLLVDDDEGHADREHAVARGVAQDGKERVGRTEEGRIEIEAGRVEEGHDDEEADLPAAEEERSLAADVADPASSATAVMKLAGSNEAAAKRRLFAPGGGRARSSEASAAAAAGDGPWDLAREDREARDGQASRAASGRADQFSKRLPTLSTLSLVTSWARVSKFAAAMLRSSCR